MAVHNGIDVSWLDSMITEKAGRPSPDPEPTPGNKAKAKKGKKDEELVVAVQLPAKGKAASDPTISDLAETINGFDLSRLEEPEGIATKKWSDAARKAALASRRAKSGAKGGLGGAGGEGVDSMKIRRQVGSTPTTLAGAGLTMSQRDKLSKGTHQEMDKLQKQPKAKLQATAEQLGISTGRDPRYSSTNRIGSASPDRNALAQRITSERAARRALRAGEKLEYMPGVAAPNLSSPHRAAQASAQKRSGQGSAEGSAPKTGISGAGGTGVGAGAPKGQVGPIKNPPTAAGPTMGGRAQHNRRRAGEPSDAELGLSPAKQVGALHQPKRTVHGAPSKTTAGGTWRGPTIPRAPANDTVASLSTVHGQSLTAYNKQLKVEARKLGLDPGQLHAYINSYQLDQAIAASKKPKG